MLSRFRVAIAVFAILLSGTAGWIFSVRAQDVDSAKISGEVRGEAGMHRAIYQVPQGTIFANFPSDLSVGDTISGTVIAQPKGKDKNELARNTAEISKYTIGIPGQKVDMSGRPFRWNVPSKLPSALAAILLMDGKNKTVAQCNLPVNPVASAPGASGIDLPLGSTGHMATALGHFGGDPPASVLAGGKEALVLAESPRKLVFLLPSGVQGNTTLTVSKGAQSASGPFRVSGVQTRIAKAVLKPAETDEASILVYGLQGIAEPVSLSLINRDPTTVSIQGGPAQEITIPPSQLSPDGTFALSRTLTGIKLGHFDIDVALVVPPNLELPVDRLSRRAIDQWSRNTGISVTPEAQSAMVSSVASAQSQLDSFLRAQQRSHADLLSLLDSLVREYCFTLRDRQLSPTGRLRPMLPRYAAAFMPFGPSLTTDDVRGFSFAQFLAKLLTRLTPSQPLGTLMVSSQPDHQQVTIDDSRDFYTTRTFTVSIGTHTVKVASCQKVLTVGPGLLVSMSCPP